MTETGSPSAYAGPDDAVSEAAPSDPAIKMDVIKPLPPETAGEVIPANPPSGENVIEVKCCPPAVEFYGAVVPGQLKFYGYDPLVNRTLPNEDSHVYWYVGPQKGKVDIEYGSLKKPGSRTDMDGSAWFSVGIGETTRFAAEFLGSGCFENVVFESEDPTIAVPVETKGKSTVMEMAVQGLKMGETTIFARCEGKLVGWVHIWCTRTTLITLDVASLLTKQTGIQLYNVERLQTYLNLVFGQMRIQFHVTDAGVIRLPEVKFANPLDAGPELEPLEPAMIAAAGDRLGSRYHVIFVVPEASLGKAVWGGQVLSGVGTSKFAYVYSYPDEYTAYQMLAHEVGHLLELSHPVDDADGDEFPPNHLNNLSSTNFNVIDGAEHYLMGYGHALGGLTHMVDWIGYHQWVKAKRY